MRKNSSALRFSLILAGLVSMWAGPAQAGKSGLHAEEECKTTLQLANKELDEARVKGLAGSVYFSKAAGLIAGAKIQQEFGKYPNCLNKARRARLHLKRAAAAG